jgi:hypothetical protein
MRHHVSSTRPEGITYPSIDALLKAETLRAERDAARRERAGVAKVEAGVAARAAALLRGIREDEGIC